jgi:hypothetical protein
LYNGKVNLGVLNFYNINHYTVTSTFGLKERSLEFSLVAAPCSIKLDHFTTPSSSTTAVGGNICLRGDFRCSNTITLNYEGVGFSFTASGGFRTYSYIIKEKKQDSTHLYVDEQTYITTGA